jgi:hypothetical protein
MDKCFSVEIGLLEECKKCPVLASCIREWNNKHIYNKRKIVYTNFNYMSKEQIKRIREDKDGST